MLAGIANEGKLYIGMSVCSLKDTFEKKKGRAIALGRAEKEILTPYVIKDLQEYSDNLSLVATSRDLTEDEVRELAELAEKIANPKKHAVLIVDITDSTEPVGKLFVKAVEEDGRWSKKPETPELLARRERKKAKREAKKAGKLTETTPVNSAVELEVTPQQ